MTKPGSALSDIARDPISTSIDLIGQDLLHLTMLLDILSCLMYSADLLLYFLLFFQIVKFLI